MKVNQTLTTLELLLNWIGRDGARAQLVRVEPRGPRRALKLGALGTPPRKFPKSRKEPRCQGPRRGTSCEYCAELSHTRFLQDNT